jgi:uncharacterized protein (DUF2141 family)
MRKIITLLAVVFSLNSFAQTAYEKAMQKGLTLLAQNKQEDASNLFERVSNTTTTEWLPAYYAAYANINASFQTKDKTKMDLYIQKAKKYLDIAAKIKPNNSEITVLRGLYYTSQVAFNPEVNGMRLSGITMETYAKAIALDSLNPRALKGQLEFQLGYDRFLNNDLSTYCSKFKAVLPLFEKKSNSKFAPNWGKETVQYHIQKLCGEKNKPSKNSQTIKVTITGFDSNQGKLKLALYDSKEHFLKELLISQKVLISNNKAEVIIENLPNGTYAISCFHDANSNDKLDRNSYGAPTEDYAFSNNATGYMGPATWEDSKFEVKDKAIEMHLKL